METTSRSIGVAPLPPPGWTKGGSDNCWMMGGIVSSALLCNAYEAINSRHSFG